MAGEMSVRLVKAFGTRFRLDVTFTLPLDPPAILILFGPSGSGKTSILRALAGLDRPDDGAIVMEQDVWYDSRLGIGRPPQQRAVGYMFQEYALFPTYTVEGNIAFGLNGVPAAERRNRVRTAIEQLKLEGLERAKPAQLSGGQQQRVALARAIARRPRLLLLDEPLSALDVPTRLALRGDLRQLLKTLRIPTVVVTHDWEEALALGDRMIVLKDGRVRQSGAPQEIFNHPRDADVAQIVGMETVMPGRVVAATEEGLVTVEVAGVRLQALGQGPEGSEGAEVFACIRAEDVVVEPAGRGPSSARNHLVGRICEITSLGAVVRVEIDCGFVLSALVTRAAREDLALAPGVTVTAAVKAGAVHLIPRRASP